MTEEEQLIEDARRSRAETQELREAAGLEAGADPGPPAPNSALPAAPDGEPSAKTSSGDADSTTGDDA